MSDKTPLVKGGQGRSDKSIESDALWWVTCAAISIIVVVILWLAGDK